MLWNRNRRNRNIFALVEPELVPYGNAFQLHEIEYKSQQILNQKQETMETMLYSFVNFFG